jgi:hypothetical protein
MMYDSKMALAVKSSGKVLRESRNGDNTTVFMPFGCEYSLLLKNLNSVKAIVKIWIDGTDVTDGTSGLIVEPNSSIDLERFIVNGNMNAGNKFKFIERTAGVSAFRGNKIDDGLIRVEFEFARRPQPIQDTYLRNAIIKGMGDSSFYNSIGGSVEGWAADAYSPQAKGVGLGGGTRGSLGDITCSAGSYSANATSTLGATFDSYVPVKQQSAKTDVGVTVAGGISDQKFQAAAWFPTDGVKHVMVMQMLGELEGQQVVKPVTVSTKAICSSCGKQNKYDAKFCSECGTGLQLVETA